MSESLAPAAPSAEVITKAAKSNLAFAFSALPPQQRTDLTTYYAYCRLIDDIADDPDIPVDERRRQLDHWRNGLSHGFENPTDIEARTVELRDRHNLPTQYLLDLIDGCEMDLTPQRFGSWEELQLYTYRVAGSVGLICVRLFECDHPGADTYARHLGDALQLTNIIRDVGEDLENGVRSYLPLGDFARFQYSERDLIGRVYDGRFKAMMTYQAERARHLYKLTEDALPKKTRSGLIATEIMRDIYFAILKKIERDDFQVFDKRYKLSKASKVLLFARCLLRHKFA